MTKQKKVAVVGATGMVGQELLRILAQRRFPISALVAMASPASAGRKVVFGDTEIEVVAATPEGFDGVDFALFSAGAGLSRELAPVAAARGAIVIDNSSAWRMDPAVPLVVPEVNMDAARVRPKGIIANPNCSTIQMVVALAPIHRAVRITRVVVSTYQAVSGAGARAVEALLTQERAVLTGNTLVPGVLGGQLAGNLLMQWKRDPDSGYQEEELKLVHETRKIMGEPSLRISPTTVRVPVAVGHSEAVAIETAQPIDAVRVRELLRDAPGIELMDDFGQDISPVYPTPLDVMGRDPVLVGRIRNDIGNPGGVMMWIVGDNLRKGAALNAVQIAEALLD